MRPAEKVPAMFFRRPHRFIKQKGKVLFRCVQISFDGREQFAFFKTGMIAQGGGKIFVPRFAGMFGRSNHGAQFGMIRFKTFAQRVVDSRPVRCEQSFFFKEMFQ